jgi:hypothetical protein
MNKKTSSKKQIFSAIILTLPFLSAIILLIVGLLTMDDIFLNKNFSLNFKAITILAFLHIVSIIVLKRYNKIVIDIHLPKSTLKKVITVFVLLILVILSNFLLEMGLHMNLNYWLKSDKVERINLKVIDKNISQGKATDYYVIFNSEYGTLNNKVKRKNFESFSIGEKYKASVNKGFFEGYFLTEPLNRKNE